MGPIDLDWLAETTVLHVPAYGLLTAADVLLTAARSVPAVTVDVSATSVVATLGHRFHQLLDELAPAVVFANAAEAAAAGLLDGAPWPMVVKRGPDPAWILCDGRRVEVPAAAVGDVRDTTGAGDAFAGGFLTAFVDGADLVESCRAGHIAAATVLATAGAGR